MAEIPMIISVDDHVVEPAHLWQTWLPERHRASAPHVERHGLGSLKYVGGTTYEYELTDDGPPCDIWFYEGKMYPPQAPRGLGRLRPRRHDAVAHHLRRDASRLLRAQGPGRRHVDEPRRGLAVVPDLPPVLRPDLHRGRGPGPRDGLRAGLQRLDGRGVVRRQRRRPDPADHHPAVGHRRRRGRDPSATPPAGVRAVCFSEIPPKLGLPSIHTGDWDPFFAACAGHRAPWCACTSARRRRCRPPRPTPRRRWPPRSASTTRWPRCRTSCSRACSCASRPSPWPTPRARSAGCPTSSSGPTTCGGSTGPGAGWPTQVPEPPSTYYYRQVYGCFFRDRHGLDALDEVGVDNITFETDYPHTDSTWPNTLAVAQDLMGHLPQDVVDKICRTNAQRMLSL